MSLSVPCRQQALSPGRGRIRAQEPKQRLLLRVLKLSPTTKQRTQHCSRSVLSETFTGDINGESPVRAPQVPRTDQSASLVSVQRFRGKLCGRQGTFVLQGSEIVQNGKIKARWLSFPGRGQENFQGCVARAALKATLEKHPRERWTIGSNDQALLRPWISFELWIFDRRLSALSLFSVPAYPSPTAQLAGIRQREQT